MNLQLSNKLALVSGSTAGIGYSIAEALLKEGADVIVNGRTQEGVDKAIAQLTPSAVGKVLGFAGDLSTEAAAHNVAQQYPNVEILVNNLGIFAPKDFEDILDEDWRLFFEVNVLSGVRLSRLYLPHMKQNNWGRIIFISSESGIQIPTEMIHYGTTKTAQLAISRGLAESLKGTNITVNSVLPGPTKSRGVDTFFQELADKQGLTYEEMEQNVFKNERPSSVIQRFATTDEVASMVAYIASPLASATTGAALRVDGGVVRNPF